ncbi:MAG: hypothetical protein LBP35_03355 [Candidatus Ancillula trichonymphae]|jgi:hypothetical protein|nr:hypothetical protein [Candidatus Ancillula trichonymphae]
MLSGDDFVLLPVKNTQDDSLHLYITDDVGSLDLEQDASISDNPPSYPQNIKEVVVGSHSCFLLQTTTGEVTIWSVDERLQVLKRTAPESSLTGSTKVWGGYNSYYALASVRDDAE